MHNEGKRYAFWIIKLRKRIVYRLHPVLMSAKLINPSPKDFLGYWPLVTGYRSLDTGHFFTLLIYSSVVACSKAKE